MNPEAELQSYLKKAGIEPAATKVYMELTKAGPASALQLAKSTGVSRTQVYRYLETLQANNLVKAEQLTYGTLFHALPLDNLEPLIAERETEAMELRTHLGGMNELLRHFVGSHGPQASTQHYFGIAGLKQAAWNLSQAKSESRVFEAASPFDTAFVRRLREQATERGLRGYTLTNSERATLTSPLSERRHIAPEIYPIIAETYVYDDIVTIFDYSKGTGATAVEIHHPTLYSTMQRLFDAMWKLATPIENE